jgi:lipopolysaccharide transport system ATP-binding protein
MHCNPIPNWAKPLLAMATAGSRYVAVRDQLSRAALEASTGVAVDVVPDSAFGLPAILDPSRDPSPAYARLAGMAGLTGPYVLIQATLGLEEFVAFLKRHSEELCGLQFLALPMGPALGEHEAIIDADLPNLVRLGEWPHPLVIAELIARSEAVVGHSYHLWITALSFGVPVFTRQSLDEGKYSALKDATTIFPLPGPDDIAGFLGKVGRGPVSGETSGRVAPVSRHWDRVAHVVRAGRVQTSETANRFWQSLPGLLEKAEGDVG